jgi:hypothetical protein
MREPDGTPVPGAHQHVWEALSGGPISGSRLPPPSRSVCQGGVAITAMPGSAAQMKVAPAQCDH